MSLASTGDGVLFASGHPGPSSQSSNPLGLITSRDGRLTWAPVSRGGQTDFHALTAHGSTIVGLDGQTLTSSTDLGRSWTERTVTDASSLALDSTTLWVAGHEGRQPAATTAQPCAPSRTLPTWCGTAAPDGTAWGRRDRRHGVAPPGFRRLGSPRDAAVGCLRPGHRRDQSAGGTHRHQRPAHRDLIGRGTCLTLNRHRRLSSDRMLRRTSDSPRAGGHPGRRTPTDAARVRVAHGRLVGADAALLAACRSQAPPSVAASVDRRTSTWPCAHGGLGRRLCRRSHPGRVCQLVACRGRMIES